MATAFNSLPLPNQLSVYRNLGEGAFSLQASYATAAGDYPSWLIASDVNRDGAPDLVSTVAGNLSVWINDRKGGFAAAATYVGNFASGIALGDVDHDGFVDIAATIDTNDPTNSIGILRNQGDGTFGAMVTYAAGNDPKV